MENESEENMELGQCEENSGEQDSEKEVKKGRKTVKGKKKVPKKKVKPPTAEAEVVEGTDETPMNSDVAVSRLESKNKRPIRRNWQHKNDMDKQFNRLFKLIRNKKKIDTLRRAIQPKNGNSHTSGSRKKVADEIVATEQPEVSYNKNVTLIANKMRECTNMEDLRALEECVAFHHRVFNDWQRNYVISKQFIEKELDAHGAAGAYETTGIKKFFVPTRESVLASLERHYRTQYHFNIEVGPHLHVNTTEKFDMILSVANLYAITRPGIQTNKKQHNSSSSSSSSSSSTSNTQGEGGGEEIVRRPETFDGSTGTCVLCNVPMINDAQHGESVCPQCGIVSRGTHNHQMSFQEQQQSSLRGAAPYERIAHVSFLFVYCFYLYILVPDCSCLFG